MACKHYWQPTAEARQYFGKLATCPLCDLEERRDTDIALAERAEREQWEERNILWEKAEASSQKYADALAEYKATLPVATRQQMDQLAAKALLLLLKSPPPKGNPIALTECEKED